MEIKKLSISEWEKLRNLYLNLLQDNPNAYVEKYENVASKTKEEWIEDLNRDGEVFVAVDDGEFVGMGRINFYTELPGIPVMHKLGVLRSHRNRGIGKKLIEAREGWGKNHGSKKIRTYVLSSNEPMKGILESEGYSIVEEDKKADTLIFEKLI